MSELEKKIHNLLDEYMEMKIMYLICQKKAELIEEKMNALDMMLSVPNSYHKPPTSLEELGINLKVENYLELVLSKDDKPRFQKWNNKKRGFAS